MLNFIRNLFRQPPEPPPGSTHLGIPWNIIDYVYVPNPLAKESSGVMYFVAANRSNDVPMLIVRRCHVNRRTGKWSYRDYVGGLPRSYRVIPDRIYNQLPDWPKLLSPYNSGKEFQRWLREKKDLIRECYEVADAHGRPWGISHYTWMCHRESALLSLNSSFRRC